MDIVYAIIRLSVPVCNSNSKLSNVGGGRILVNGAYFATDMKSNVEQEWLAKFFKVSAAGSNQDNYNSIINGLGSQFDII